MSVWWTIVSFRGALLADIALRFICLDNQSVGVCLAKQAILGNKKHHIASPNGAFRRLKCTILKSDIIMTVWQSKAYVLPIVYIKLC